MKRRERGALYWRIVVIAAAILGGRGITDAQAGTFVNLDFEDAVVSGPPYDPSQLLPGWDFRSTLGHVIYDGMTISTVCVSIHDRYSPYVQPLAGNYTVLLQDGYDDHGMALQSAYISQTGDVPSWAKSLVFASDTTLWIDELQVSLGDTVLPFTLDGVGDTVNPKWGPVKWYICDVSAFTGQTDVTLKFEKLVHDPENPANHSGVDLDSIMFLDIIIPEPSSLALVAAAAISLAVFCRRRRNRSA